MLLTFVTVFMVSDEERTNHPSRHYTLLRDPLFVLIQLLRGFPSSLTSGDLHHSLGPLPSSLRFFLSVLQIDCFY